MSKTIIEAAQAAQIAARSLTDLSVSQRNSALQSIKDALERNAVDIFSANRRDVEAAQRNNIAPALLKRLRFQQEQLEAVCGGIDALIALDDPLGRQLEARELDTHLNLYRRTVPIGVIGIVFESRPDALVQIATLCLKSGNACIMKGGSEAAHTNNILARCICDATAASSVADNWLTLLTTRSAIQELITLDAYVDLIIPRGSNQFVHSILEQSTVAVLGHAEGICHIYIDAEADLRMAESILIDAKTEYSATCNAVETVLIHRAIAPSFAPLLINTLAKRGVIVYGDSDAQQYAENVLPLLESGWQTEYLDLKISLRVVDTVEAAITHINQFGSQHTDAIITTNLNTAKQFMRAVDSATVVHNTSTRFSDGYRYGLGAEIGISTTKIHARGPVGMEGLLSYKWYLYGDGHVVSRYSGRAARPFTHRSLP